MSTDGETENTTASTLLEAEWLVSAVAHDLKAPLVTIQSFLPSLETSARAGDWDQFTADTARIQRLCDRMRQMLDDLRELMLQRPCVSDKQPGISLQSLIHEALEHLQWLQPATPICLSGEFPVISGHHNRLLRLFQNLLENAVQSLVDCVDPSISIESHCDGSTVFVTIRDNGRGASPEELARLLTPHRQLGGQLAPAGLGLSIAQRIAHAHGGNLKLASDGVGCGMTVTVALPLLDVPSPGSV